VTGVLLRCRSADASTRVWDRPPTYAVVSLSSSVMGPAALSSAFLLRILPRSALSRVGDRQFSPDLAQDRHGSTERDMFTADC
jgi:hypothetical protein